MAAVIFTARQIAAFAAVVSLGLVLLMAVPSPYPEGVRPEPSTGAPVPDAWHRLQDARATGDAAEALHGLTRMAGEMRATPLLLRMAALMEQELQPLELGPVADPVTAAGAELLAALAAAADDRTGDAVEGFFRGAASGVRAIDTRAAELRRRLRGAHPPALGELLSLCAEFGRRGRHRAQWRWLLRTLQAHPQSTAAADEVMRICIERGRLEEALAVSAAGTAGRAADVAFQRRRARLGAWLGRAEVEAEALEHLVARTAEPADRLRLIDLCTHLGEPERALAHASALSAGGADLAAAGAAADAALRAGFVDEGLLILTRAASRAADPGPWRRRIADIALQDLRTDRAALELERALAADPAALDPTLESLYRRTDQPGPLADVLQRRLARTPADARPWHELLTLRFGLGQMALARRLARQRAAALVDPEPVLQQVPDTLRGEAASVWREALSLALAPGARGPLPWQVLDRLQPFCELPQFRAVTEALLLAFADDPAVRPMLVDLLDVGRTPREAAAAAAELAECYPGDAAIVRLWVERAGWAGEPDAEIAARERLLELMPGDAGNRRQLAALLGFAGRTGAAVPLWRRLVAEEGIGSAALPELVAGLSALGRDDEALSLLLAAAEAPAATAADRLRAADEFFYRQDFERAGALYAAVLQTEGEHPLALLRLGQIHAWSGDPDTARGWFERRLRASEADGPLVQFHLGETLWASAPARAADLQRQALAAMQLVARPDFATQRMIAAMLARLGRRGEAAAIYRELVARSPRDLHLVLDYVGVLVEDGRLLQADALLRHARALDADSGRVLRQWAELARKRGDPAAADLAYTRAMELHGMDAGILADQAALRRESGDWQGALASVQRWLQLKSDDAVARRMAGDLRDRLAGAAIGTVRALRLGGDRVLEATASAVLPAGDRRRFHVRAGHGHYEGAAAVLGGARASLDTGLLDLALESRLEGSDTWTLGIGAALGAPGDLPVGAFAAANLQGGEPFASLELRACAHELWTEPAVAAALGGRRSGLEARAYAELPGGFWVGATGAAERLEIDPDGGAPAADQRLRGEVSFGRRFLDGDVAVASRFEPRGAPAGPLSPFLLADPDGARGWSAAAWISLQGATLLGDAELPALIPIAKVDEQLSAAGRVDRHLLRGLGGSAAGRIGVDLRSGEQVWGVDLAVTWRPSFGGEVTLAGGHGSAFGRGGGDDVDELRLEAVLRW